MLKRLFILFVFLNSISAFSQTSKVVEKEGIGSKKDTIIIKIDTANKKVVLLSKNKSITEFQISKVNPILTSDSLAWSIKTKSDKNKVLTIINRFASSEVKIDTAGFANFLSSKKDTVFLVFNAGPSVVSDPEQAGNGGGGGIIGDPSIKKTFFERHLTSILLVLLIIFFILCIVFLILWRLESSKIKLHKKEKEISVGNKIFEELKKHFPEGLQSKEYKGENTQTLIEHISAIYKESKNKIASLNNDVKNAKESDLQKHTTIQDLQKQIDILNSKLNTISKEHEDKLKDYRASIIEICKKMLVKYREFDAKYQGGTIDVDLAKKDIIHFNIAYTQLASDVFAMLAESATEEAKMNIELLNGKTVTPIKVVDQFADKGSLSTLVKLIIQILVNNNIKSIDGVYFEGNKIDLK